MLSLPVSPLSEYITAQGYVVDPSTPKTDALAWLYRLDSRLAAERRGRIIQHIDGSYEQRAGLTLLDSYYSGNHPLPEVVDSETRTRFLEFMRRSRSNYMQIVVDAEKERLSLQGIRVGEPSDAVPDPETWSILKANGVDSSFATAAQVALTQRRCYWSVWYAPGSSSLPVIALEDPQQCIVEYEAGNRRRRAAGLKTWIDDWTGARCANVYLPTMTYKFIWDNGTAGPNGVSRPSGWYEREAAEVNPLGVVPLVPMVNRPTLALDPDGRSEIDTLLPIQDRINQTILNRQVAEHHSAFKQKWATGMHIPLDENGEPYQSFKSAIDTFWVNSNPDGKWGEFSATDLANYSGAKDSDIQDVAVISATPRHYFTVNGQAPSGDSMKSAEASLVAKCEDFQSTSGGPAMIEVTSLARRIAGLPDVPVRPIWGDPEYRTYAQLVDGTVKLVNERIISRKFAREQIGMSPPDAKRVEDEIAEEMAQEAAAAQRNAVQAADLAPSSAEPVTP